MICPMLSQSQRDEEGSVSWDHHECIEGACTFWSDGLGDCGIRASGLVTITRARSMLAGAAGDGSWRLAKGTEPLIEALLKNEASALEPLLAAVEKANSNLRDTGLKLLEGVVALEGPIKATGYELGTKLAGIERRFEELSRRDDRIQRLEEVLASANDVKDLGERLDTLEAGVKAVAAGVTEKVARVTESLEEVRHLGAGIERLERCVATVSSHVEARCLRVEESLDEVSRTVRGASAAKPDYMTDLDDSLSALGGRFASLSERLDALASQMADIREAHEQISGDLAKESESRKLDEKLRRKQEARALNTRGVALFHRGACEAAESCFRSALRLEPELAEAHNNLGLALGKQGKSAEAEECFRKALELDPGLAEAMSNLGFLFHQGMEFEKAVEMFRQSALTGEDTSLAYTNLGTACYKLGRFSDAVEAWKKAVDQNPLNENALRALRMFEQSPPHRH